MQIVGKDTIGQDIMIEATALPYNGIDLAFRQESKLQMCNFPKGTPVSNLSMTFASRSTSTYVSNFFQLHS